MVYGTAATTNDHGKTRRSPMFRVNDFVPNRGMGLLLMACSVPILSCRLSEGEAGITLTLAPVSTRKHTPVTFSVTKKSHGRSFTLPSPLAATSAGQKRFSGTARRYMASYTSFTGLQIIRGTNRDQKMCQAKESDRQATKVDHDESDMKEAIWKGLVPSPSDDLLGHVDLTALYRTVQ